MRTGAQRWQFQLSVKEPEALSLLRHSSFAKWWTRKTSAGLVVAQLISDDQLSFDVLDLGTGVSAGHKLLATSGSSRDVLLDDRLAWVVSKGRVQAIPLPDGAVAYRFP